MTDEQMTRVNYYWIRYYCFVVTQLSQGKMMTVGISLKQLFQLCSGKYLKSGPSKFKAVSKVCLCCLCQDSLTEKGGEKNSVRLNWLGWGKRDAEQRNTKGWTRAPHKLPEFVCEFRFFLIFDWSQVCLLYISYVSTVQWKSGVCVEFFPAAGSDTTARFGSGRFGFNCFLVDVHIYSF